VALDPAAAVVHGDATITQITPLTFVTPAVPWAYAVSVPMDLGQAGDAFIEAIVTVTGASVGVSCASADYLTLTDEIVVAPRYEQQTIHVLTSEAPQGWLLFRTGPDAVEATVSVHRLSVQLLPPGLRTAEASPARPLAPTPNWSRFYGAPGGPLDVRLRVREFERLTAPVRHEWVEGLTLVLHPREQSSRAVYVSGLYEPNTAVVLKRLLAPGSIFLDVGANIGLFTLLGARWVGDTGRVISFEPSERERRRLEEHVAINRLSNVTIVDQAVGAHDGTVDLRVAQAEYAGLNTVGETFCYPGVQVVETRRVPQVKLDRVVEQEGLRALSVVKLDIEGAEYSALQGAEHILRVHRPVFIIEIVVAALRLTGGATPEAIARLLKAASYRLYTISEETAALSPVDGLEGIDAQNVVAAPNERRLV
jgi:FkbM family methyltransferase